MHGRQTLFRTYLHWWSKIELLLKDIEYVLSVKPMSILIYDSYQTTVSCATGVGEGAVELAFAYFIFSHL